MNKEKENASGCLDPTAYEAIKNVDRESKKSEARMKKLITVIFYICELAGFHIEGRLVLKDKKTGKVWR